MEHHMTTSPTLSPAEQGLEHRIELLDLDVCVTKPVRDTRGIPINTKGATNPFGAAGIRVYV